MKDGLKGKRNRRGETGGGEVGLYGIRPLCLFLMGKIVVVNYLLMMLIFEGKNLKGKSVLIQHNFGGKMMSIF